MDIAILKFTEYILLVLNPFNAISSIKLRVIVFIVILGHRYVGNLVMAPLLALQVQICVHLIRHFQHIVHFKVPLTATTT